MWLDEYLKLMKEGLPNCQIEVTSGNIINQRHDFVQLSDHTVWFVEVIQNQRVGVMVTGLGAELSKTLSTDCINKLKDEKKCG